MPEHERLQIALQQTGFEPCEFETADEECEHCGSKRGDLFFGNRDYWDSREGNYLCGSCVIELHQDNEAALVSVLGGTIREFPQG